MENRSRGRPWGSPPQAVQMLAADAAHPTPASGPSGGKAWNAKRPELAQIQQTCSARGVDAATSIRPNSAHIGVPVRPVRLVALDGGVFATGRVAMKKNGRLREFNA